MLPRKLPLLFLLTFVIACSALPGRDLRNEYVEIVKRQGLTPVYPPREEFQVGDVFIRSYSADDPTELDTRAVVWLATLQSMREQANKYLESRITFADTNINTKASGGNKEFDLQPGQPDFAAGVVALNDGARRSLPIVAFPTIKGSAASAGALGGYGFLRSFGLAVGSSEQVELDFTDTRAFGVPLGAAAASGKYEKEYTNTVCAIIDKQRNRNLAEIGFQRLGLVAESVDVPKEEMCGEGRICDIAVITRTYLTRRVVFTYSSARVARLAAAARRSPAPEDAKTVPIPGNLSVDITLAPDPDGTQIKDLVNGLSSAVTSSGGEDIESSALSFLGFQGNSIAFQRVYLKPVAIAYDSINFNLKGGPETCGVAPPKVED